MDERQTVTEKETEWEASHKIIFQKLGTFSFPKTSIRQSKEVISNDKHFVFDLLNIKNFITTTMSVTGKRIVDRGGSIGEPRPQKQLVQDDVVTLRFVMDNFRGRSMNWQIGFESPVLKAHGYHWKLFISPSSEGEQWFYLKVGDELREPMLVEATWRFHRGCGHEALKTIGKTQHNGYVTRCSAVAHVDFVHGLEALAKFGGPLPPSLSTRNNPMRPSGMLNRCW